MAGLGGGGKGNGGVEVSGSVLLTWHEKVSTLICFPSPSPWGVIIRWSGGSWEDLRLECRERFKS